MLLLRIGRLKTLWDPSNTIATIVELAFSDENGQPDLKLSVYQVEAAHVVQTFVEHTAAANLKRPNGRPHVDLTGAPAAVRPDPLQGPFALIRESHCELHFGDSAALSTFLTRVRDEIASRLHEVTTSQIKQYVRKQLAAGNPEWVTYVAANENWNL